VIPLEEIFCLIDDFCKLFEKKREGYFLATSARKRHKACQMSLSEIMMIEVMFHFSHYRTFKDFYKNCILDTYQDAFPKALSYNRFLELKQYALMPLAVFLSALKGQKTGLYYMDSTKLPVCNNLRISRNKVFKDCAKRGKTSTGWFFGFKLHIVFNHLGDIMSFKLTPGNVDDRQPVLELTKHLEGWLFGDRGYISKKLSLNLKQKGIEMINNVKKNMKKILLTPIKKYLLSKRGFVETIIDKLKNILHIDHSRHRSVVNFQVNVLGALLSYVFKPKKASVPFSALNHQSLSLTSS